MLGDTMQFLKMADLDLKGLRVFIREDLNVPLQDGKITSEARLIASLPTIQLALKKGAAVLVTSHLGRPTAGEYDPAFSLAPIAAWLTEKLGQPVELVKDWIDGVDIQPGQVKLLENCRFLVGEKKNDEALSKKMAALCDVYVMDAFATSHRAESSTMGAGMFAAKACAGPLLAAELEALTNALAKPARPMVAIVGGSKVSTKLTVLNHLLDKVDQLIPGGGITNTLLAATGVNIGKSLVEMDLLDEARALLAKATSEGKSIELPTDVVVGKSFDANTPATIKKLSEIADDDMIFDIGPETIASYEKLMKAAKTIVWNGPVGVFEFAAFANGTKTLGKAIAESSAFSIAGGGDTVAAIEEFGLTKGISYISTAGGAFLEFLEGKELPAVTMLEKRAK